MTDRIERECEKFHTENPWVYGKLRIMALQLKRTGRGTYGIAALFEVLRYEHAVKTNSDDGFKLNNNFRAIYARKLARNEPELREFFKMRVRKARHTQSVDASVDAWDNLISQEENSF